MELLDEAERKDGYRAACHANLLNDRARERQEYSFYPDPLGKRISSIAATYEIAKGSQIVTLHPSADNGYPHTRPGIMCFPVRPYTTSQLTETVLHEALHLHQRNNLDLWTTYSVKQGWWPVPKEVLPEKWRLRCRINPDTMYTISLSLFSKMNSRHRCKDVLSAGLIRDQKHFFQHLRAHLLIDMARFHSLNIRLKRAQLRFHTKVYQLKID